RGQPPRPVDLDAPRRLRARPLRRAARRAPPPQIRLAAFRRRRAHLPRPPVLAHRGLALPAPPAAPLSAARARRLDPAHEVPALRAPGRQPAAHPRAPALTDRPSLSTRP